jgi:hypothetical protein
MIIAFLNSFFQMFDAQGIVLSDIDAFHVDGNGDDDDGFASLTRDISEQRPIATIPYFNLYCCVLLPYTLTSLYTHINIEHLDTSGPIPAISRFLNAYHPLLDPANNQTRPNCQPSHQPQHL